MKWFVNLSTPVKLILAFGAMWLLLAIVVVTARQGIVGVTRSERHLHDVNFATEIGLLDIRANMNLNRARMLEMLMTTDTSEMAVIRQDIQGRAATIDSAVERVGVLLTGDSECEKLLAELKGALALYRQGREKEIALVFEGKTDEARLAGLGTQGELFDKVRDIAVELSNKSDADQTAQLTADQNMATRSTRLLLVLGVLALFVGIGMSVLLQTTMARPLVDLAKVATRIAGGDLAVAIPADTRKDELGAMTQAFRKMVENLRRTITDLGEGIAVLTSSASEILAGTTQVAAGASESAAAISETTTTVEEVRQAARLSSEKAKAVADNAQHVAQISRSGQKAVEENAAGMLNIRKQVESIAQTIIRLSEQSQLIGGITAAVTDLADQSNVLAVNAAIEAARAGEQGKGFAVVAQEIRSLAEQSKQATTQVRAILNDVQKATSAVVMATEQGTKAVEAGVEQSTLAGEAIRALAESTSEAAQTATQIVASIQQQVVGMDQIGTAMQNINQAGTQTAASMRQSETSARSLHELGLKLKQLVAQYQV